MTRASILVLALATLALPACGSKKEGGGGGGGDKPAAVTLAKLGVQLDIAGEATPGDGMGEQSVMITGSEIGAMSVDLKKEAKPLEEGKSDANMFSPKNLKVDTLADGYAITFNNKGGMDNENFFVDVQRTIGGKFYSCSTTTNSAERQANVLAACKSLRAAGGAAPAAPPAK